MHPFETLYVRLEPHLDVSYPQVDEIVQVLHKIGVPSRVIKGLPLNFLIPGITKGCKWTFVVSHGGSRPCEHESRISILRFDYNIRVEILALLVGHTATLAGRLPSAVLDWGKFRTIQSPMH